MRQGTLGILALGKAGSAPHLPGRRPRAPLPPMQRSCPGRTPRPSRSPSSKGRWVSCWNPRCFAQWSLTWEGAAPADVSTSVLGGLGSSAALSLHSQKFPLQQKVLME